VKEVLLGESLLRRYIMSIYDTIQVVANDSHLTNLTAGDSVLLPVFPRKLPSKARGTLSHSPLRIRTSFTPKPIQVSCLIRLSKGAPCTVLEFFPTNYNPDNDTLLLSSTPLSSLQRQSTTSPKVTNNPLTLILLLD
jgi:hypothetical protein